jgi:hypothetical protein
VLKTLQTAKSTVTDRAEAQTVNDNAKAEFDNTRNGDSGTPPTNGSVSIATTLQTGLSSEEDPAARMTMIHQVAGTEFPNGVEPMVPGQEGTDVESGYAPELVVAFSNDAKAGVVAAEIFSYAMQATVLAEWYRTLTQVTFVTQDDVIAERNLIESAYQTLISNTSAEVKRSLDFLRAQALAFLATKETQVERRVERTTPRKITVAHAAMREYGETSRAEEIANLNDLTGSIIPVGTYFIYSR